MSVKRRGIPNTKDETLHQGLVDTMLIQEEVIGEGHVELIEISLVSVDPNNPRSLDKVSQQVILDFISNRENAELTADDEKHIERIMELAGSIQHHGLLQPVVVEQTTTGRFNLVAGERRYYAHLYLGRKMIRALIRPSRSEEDRFLASIVENDLREDLSFRDYVTALRKVIDNYTQSTGNEPSLQDLSRITHKSRSTLSTLRQIACNDEMLQKVQSGRIKSHLGAIKALKTSSQPKDKTKDTEQKIRLGSFASGVAVRWIAEKLFGNDAYKDVDWDDQDQVENTWKELATRIEDEATKTP